MIRLRYTAWDGRQQVGLDGERVFAALASRLARSDDLAEALSWLLQEGIDLGAGERAAGLAGLLRRVREALQERYRRLDLESALSELWRKVLRVRQLEAGPGAESGTQPLRSGRLPGVVPARLGDAIAQLERCPLEQELSRQLLRELLMELDRVRALEGILPLGSGRSKEAEALSYSEAVALLEGIEKLKELEGLLLRGDLAAIDHGELNALLGSQAADDLDAAAAMLQLLQGGGYLLQREGRAVLSPKGIRRIGQLALRDIYHGMMQGRVGGHGTGREGAGEMRLETSNPFAYGQPLHIDLTGTLKRALTRRATIPLKIEPGDFMVFDAEYATSAATVLLLDMSWSMSWEGRFAAAKKVAMAMESLVRAKFPRDFFAIVGFFTRAVELKLTDLPEASWNIGDPFTNLQDGLRMAGRLLSRQRLGNQQVILITDGQPTAYFSGGRLYCEWPLSFGGIGMHAAQAALEEAARLTRLGIKINTFMLDDSPNLKVFVERMTQLNRGRALYTRPDTLGHYVLVDYVERKRRKG